MSELTQFNYRLELLAKEIFWQGYRFAFKKMGKDKFEAARLLTREAHEELNKLGFNLPDPDQT